MSAPLFLVEEIPAGDSFTLTGPEGRHAADVQRLRVGEALVLADGRGSSAQAVVTAVTKGALTVAIGARDQQGEPAVRLTVCQGLPKGERAELAVQLMTELGVDEIVPWAANRCVVRWTGERGERSRQRWQVTAREAAKQARRVRIPVIAAMAGTADLAAGITGASLWLVLHEEAERSLAQAVAADPVAAGVSEIVLLVGPEGGIAPEEVGQLVAAGAVPVRMGQNVLRTSTAGAAAIAALSARIGRW